MRVSSIVVLIGSVCCLHLSLGWQARADEPTTKAGSQTPANPFARGDKGLADYMQAETRKLADACLSNVNTLAEWEKVRGEYYRQLREMLGLDPWPERTPLATTIVGTTEHPEFVVKRLHFQSRPGLYVTGDLYMPKKIDKPLPAILYVCGHGVVKKDGVSYGNKVTYQHHGGWFARNGFVCLTIDTIQLGEIEGLHHGTYKLNNWWWVARGYTPAGVEAWNSIRALDVLESLPEVDKTRIGVTGRSGGGAYSWWTATLDERVKVAVPVAGITDLENHVVDGCVEGHCDCMYMVNTYRWDYPLVAALVAPRPLLISNTDKDKIFPLDGVYRVHEKVKKVYKLYGAEDKLGFHITEGPHKDTQELHIHAFRWFNRFLKNEQPEIDQPAVKFFQPEQLKVFPNDGLPKDEIVTKIQESFVPLATTSVPESTDAWTKMEAGWMTALKEKAFRGWPAETGDSQSGLDLKELFSAEKDGVQLRAYEFTSQAGVRLPLYVMHRAGLDKPSLTVLNVLDEAGWEKTAAMLRAGFADKLSSNAPNLPEADAKSLEDNRKMFKAFPWVMAYVAPRGVGPTAWSGDERKKTQIRRRFYLLGQTLEGMQVWDARRAVQAVRTIADLKAVPLWMQGERQAAGITLYASLFEPDIKRLDLHELPQSHRQGPTFFNVMRYLDVPQAVAMAAGRSQVKLYQSTAEGWDYPKAVAKQLAWNAKQLDIRVPKEKGEAGEPNGAKERDNRKGAETSK